MDKQTDRMQSLLDEDIGAIVMEGKKRTRKKIGGAICILIIAAMFLVGWMLMREYKYNMAVDSYDNDEYEQAVRLFNELGNYKDSVERLADANSALIKANYYQGIENLNSGLYESAANCFKRAGNYNMMSTAYQIMAYVEGEFYTTELPEIIDQMIIGNPILESSSFDYNYSGYVGDNSDWHATLYIAFELTEKPEKTDDFLTSVNYVGGRLRLYAFESDAYEWINVVVYGSDGETFCNRTYSVERGDYYIENGESYNMDWNQVVETYHEILTS